MSNGSIVHPVDEKLPLPRLGALGLQHVLVMCAGAVAVPLIIDRALKLTPDQVALLTSADLFCCDMITLIQALGATQWFGIRLPMMMGGDLRPRRAMIAMAGSNPGISSAQLIFGSIIGAGVVSILTAPVVSRMLRFFREWVTGTIIAATGIRILAGVNFKGNRFNSLIVAILIGVGMIPLIAPNFKQGMPHGIHPLIESGILLTSIAALALNLFFVGASGDASAAINAAKRADAH